jgi:hypothetical protein
MRISSTLVLAGHLALGSLGGLLAAGPARADNAASTCAGTTVNGAANTCYTLTAPPVPATAITVNGAEGAGEWALAQTKNLTGDMTGTLKVVRTTGDGQALYLLITVNDSAYQAGDRVRIFVDPLHSHAETGDDIEFRIVRDTGGSPDHRRITAAGDNAWTPAPGTVATSSAAGAWTVEVRLVPGELGVPDLPPVLGLGVQAEDASTGNLALWPENFDSGSPATSWANVKTRYPIEYMLVLDQSGSMLSQGKWANAKRAANLLANTMAILRDAGHFQDRIGVVTFSWLCSGADQTSTPKVLAQVPAFPLGNYTDNPPALADPLGDFCTPIGKGLERAFAAANLDAATPTVTKERQRVVLLLSDGLQNRPSSSLVPADTTYDPCPFVMGWEPCGPDAPSNVRVDTVALGDDAGVDTTLLTRIRDRYAGAFAATYSITTDPEVLKETFLSSLEELYQVNLAFSGASGTTFTVDPGNRNLAVVMSWTTPASAASFGLRQRDTPAAPWSAVACTASGTDTSVGFSTCAVDAPKAGEWQAVDGGGNPFNVADRQFVLLDLYLRARFAVDQRVHGTGQDIVLTADLRQGGRPVTHDASTRPVKVTVTIQRPTEGFGTFASTHETEGCRTVEPTLPPINRLRGGGGAPLAAPAPGPAPAATGTVTDPPAPPFALMAQLLKACGKPGLSRGQDPALELHDDGTQGDLIAGDGIYTLRFAGTEFEGSYVFRFLAGGTAPDGATFTRTRLLAEYVRVHVDPARTGAGSRVVQQTGNLVLREFHVTPRDRFGGYLGPGHADQVQFTATGGQWLGAVADYGNGIYARLLRYDRTAGEPVVTPVVQGTPIPPPRTFELPWWLCLLIILVLLLALLAVLALWWLRPRRIPA